MIEQVEQAVRAGLAAWQAERHKLDDESIEAIVEYFKAKPNPVAWREYGPVMHSEIEACVIEIIANRINGRRLSNAV